MANNSCKKKSLGLERKHKHKFIKIDLLLKKYVKGIIIGNNLLRTLTVHDDVKRMYPFHGIDLILI